MVREISLKVIESYEDLKNIKVGEKFFLNNSVQFAFDPFEEFKNYGFFDKEDKGKNKFYTLSIEGTFFVQNQYDLYDSKDTIYLIPFHKISCRKGCDTALENALSEIAKREGMIK